MGVNAALDLKDKLLTAIWKSRHQHVGIGVGIGIGIGI